MALNRFAVGIFVLAALPAQAMTIASRTGSAAASASGIGCDACDTSFAVTWTQPAAYSGVAITANLLTIDGLAAGGTAYLTNSTGPGAANVVPPATFTLPAGAPETPAPITLFSGLTLPAGTYYLTISNGSGNLGWAYVYGGAAENTAAGVTIGPDLQDFGALTAYPPAAATFGTFPVSAGGATHILLFSVTTAVSIDTLSIWGFSVAVALLIGSGLILTGKSWVHAIHT